jgi:hypothetical protein
MRRNWLTIPLVVVVGALAGAAIAGRPTAPPNDVRISPAAAATSTSTTPSVPPTLVPATAASATTVPVAGAAATAAPGTAAGTSTSPTSQPTAPSPPASATTAPRATTTVFAAPAPVAERESIRVVVANGTDRARLAGELADELEALGYVDVVRTDADRNYGSSVVYADEELRPQALRVAADLEVDPRFVLDAAGAPVSDADVTGDVIVVAGADRAGP